MNKPYTFKTSLYTGDIISTLPGIREACRRGETKADIYIWIDRHGHSYDGAVHPYQGKMMTDYSYEMLKPLLEEQEYVMQVSKWHGETIAVDLDMLRQVNVGMPYGSIHRWPFYMWPDMACDLSIPWLRVDPDTHDFRTAGMVLINRTSRYHNGFINYFFLKEYKEKLMFCGLEEEHLAFCTEWEIDIPLLKVNNFLELAVAMDGCKFFLGNQSACYAIAEGLKIPRMLEVCPFAPNVIPCGGEAYDFMRQEALEFMFKDLMERL